MRLILLIPLLCPLICLSQPKSPPIADGIRYYHDLFSVTEGDSVSCYRIPAMVTAPNGDLLVAIDERVPSCGDLRGSKNINIVMRRSQNNGKTWSAIERVVDLPWGQSASDPSMVVDEITGEIFLFYNFMDLDKELNVYYLHLVKSGDNGKSWTKPIDITAQITNPAWKNDFKFITSGRGIQTRDGVLLHTLVNLEKGLFLFGSRDHGKSWFFIETAVSPADESKVIELADGRWMINSRVNGQKLRYVHISKDKGQTWESYPDSSLIDPNCNASIVRYSSAKNGDDKNILLFSNANSETSRSNMTVRVSYDEGKTWSVGKVIYPGGSAYSTMTVLKNGDIGLVFEKDNYSENVFVSFTLDWLSDDRD